MMEFACEETGKTLGDAKLVLSLKNKTSAELVQVMIVEFSMGGLARLVRAPNVESITRSCKIETANKETWSASILICLREMGIPADHHQEVKSWIRKFFKRYGMVPRPDEHSEADDAQAKRDADVPECLKPRIILFPVERLSNPPPRPKELHRSERESTGSFF